MADLNQQKSDKIAVHEKENAEFQAKKAAEEAKLQRKWDRDLDVVVK